MGLAHVDERPLGADLDDLLLGVGLHEENDVGGLAERDPQARLDLGAEAPRLAAHGVLADGQVHELELAAGVREEGAIAPDEGAARERDLHAGHRAAVDVLGAAGDAAVGLGRGEDRP